MDLNLDQLTFGIPANATIKKELKEAEKEAFPNTPVVTVAGEKKDTKKHISKFSFNSNARLLLGISDEMNEDREFTGNRNVLFLGTPEGAAFARVVDFPGQETSIHTLRKNNSFSDKEMESYILEKCYLNYLNSSTNPEDWKYLEKHFELKSINVSAGDRTVTIFGLSAIIENNVAKPIETETVMVDPSETEQGEPVGDSFPNMSNTDDTEIISSEEHLVVNDVEEEAPHQEVSLEQSWE